jgi:hypothetical protein
VTGRDELAGTVAELRMRIHGSKSRESGVLSLEQSNHDVMFEPGQRDTFAFMLPDLGKGGAKSVSVWHDSEMEGDEWQLDYVIVVDVKRKLHHRFQFNNAWVGPPPNLLTLARTSVTSLAKATRPKASLSAPAGLVTGTGLWMNKTATHQPKTQPPDDPDEEEKEKAARFQGWLNAANGKIRKKKQAAKELESHKAALAEEKAEDKKAAATFHKKWDAKKRRQAREMAAEAERAAKTAAEKAERLKAARLKFRSERAFDTETWLAKKDDERKAKAKAKADTRANRIEVEHRRRQQNGAATEAWARTLEKKAFRSTGKAVRRVEADVAEAHRINASLRNPVYYSPATEGPAVQLNPQSVRMKFVHPEANVPQRWLYGARAALGKPSDEGWGYGGD